MESFLKLAGGTVIDPVSKMAGEVRDIWIRGGKIVSPPTESVAHTTIDVAGRIVMAGAVDMHCHIAGPKVNTARKMQSEQQRSKPQSLTALEDGILHSGSLGSVPSIFTTGYRYTGLGYTTCFDAAIPPLAARHAHFEFEQIPNVDTGFFTMVGNNHYLMDCIARGDES